MPLSTTPPIFSHCNVPPWIIASPEFQENPVALELGHIRTTDRRLWERLDAIPDQPTRGQTFHDYISVKFRLHEWADHQANARLALRQNYIWLIRDWGVDSNGPAGAAWKSWVESRFGLRPSYHGGVLSRDPGARERLTRDRMRATARTQGLFMQIDMLYSYAQYELARRQPDTGHLTLYRGTHDPEEYQAEPLPEKPGLQVTLNNLSSFTSNRETAWEFGSCVWQVKVPCAKVVFFSGLLPSNLLQGENEYLVIGGTYRVKPLLY